MNSDLIFIRNTLLKGISSPEIVDSLQRTLSSLISYQNPFYPICQEAINNALNDIKDGNIESAGYQINLIHNMPFLLSELNNWDENHFYEFELPVFFENTDNVFRIKKMILLLAELIKSK